MNSGLSIKRLTAFAVAFVLVSGLGLPGSSLIPEGSGLTSIIDGLGSDSWADDKKKKKKKKKVPTIVVVAPRIPGGGETHPGGHIPMGPGGGGPTQPYDPSNDLQAACDLAVSAANSLGATGFTGSVLDAAAAYAACNKVKNKKTAAACGLAVTTALGACSLAN